MSTITEAQILEVLKSIIDPDLKRDIVSLGFIKNMQISGGEVAFTIELTTPACPVKEQFRQQATAVVSALEGVTRVNVTMSAKVQGDGGEKQALLPGVKNIIAVASGKGGVGKSTTAVNLALALKQSGASVGILDADIYGPSLPTLLGITEKPREAEGEKKVMPVDAHGLKAISMGMFLAEDAPMIWRGPMVGMAVEQLLRDVAWGELDYMIVDLPPGTGDAQLTLSQKVPITGVVIVSTPQDVALADVRKGISMFKKVSVPVLGVIENMSYYICPDCGHRDEIFSHGGAKQEAKQAKMDFLGEIPLDPSIRMDADDGTPIVAARPDHAQSKIYMEIASRIAPIIATNQRRKAAFPKIVVE